MNQNELPLSRLDKAFARFLVEKTDLAKTEQTELTTIISSLSCLQNQGHSCLRLDSQQQHLLNRSGLCSDNQNTPLILEQGRLYLHRYWHYETRLAQRLSHLALNTGLMNIDPEILDRYFPVISADADWQRLAAEQSLLNQLSIITGGPGTGKTTTVVKILALLQTLHEQPLHIALAAPTGKAANRLQQSIGSNLQKLPCDQTIKSLIPDQVSTIHRLLGAQHASPYFHHHQGNPLPYDLVVIDEASMVDLALMSKLLDALKDTARLILLGDKDQLASVESGAVLADVTTALPNHTQALHTAFRFNQDIKALADAINQQQAELAWELLLQGNPGAGLYDGDLSDYLLKANQDYLQLMREGATVGDIFKAFNQFQVLSATRLGRHSVADINQQTEQRLAESGMIKITGQWYAGRPVMVTQNDPVMKLYNGDIGICLADPTQQGQLMVFFEMPDGSEKKFLPTRLPHCETVYAMTIHKSQGSEFDQVLITLPEQINPGLTRELLYTAITRAKTQVRLLCSETIFKHAAIQQVSRDGGLAEKLIDFQTQAQRPCINSSQPGH